ncbi:MAG: HEAT repeat domain-containing protein [Polyangia bacterium]
MRSRAPFFPAAFAVLYVLLSPLSASSQGRQPPPPAQEQVQVPDSSGWSVHQAVANLRASERGVRLAALRRLAEEPGENIRKWIAETAQYDPEPRIRYEAVNILAKRAESASVPVLMQIAQNDKDDRVATAARVALQKSGHAPPGTAAPSRPAPAGGQAQTGQPAAASPGQPQQQQPQQPQQPQPPRRKEYDEEGNELPPGYLDAGGGGGSMIDEELLAASKEDKRVHSGFLPALGFDGEMGSPRTTLARSSVGIQLGLEHSGVYNEVLTTTANAMVISEIEGLNDYELTDFSVLLGGTWSPWEFLELGLGVEVLTAEKLSHDQLWKYREGTNEGETIDPTENDTAAEYVYDDSSYSGAAFGFLSLDIKTLFHRSEIARIGMALRVTFPTHSGERFQSGIGAASLYLPVRSWDRNVHETRDATMWGIEPGIIASFAPIDHLTIYADITYLVTVLSYTEYEHGLKDNQQTQEKEDLSAAGMFMIPNLGAQYRLLDESLGIQLALQPTVYLGTAQSAAMASFGIVPGVAYTIAEMVELSLTASIEAGGDASKPLYCTDLEPSDDSPPIPCGVGRRFGFALQASYAF